MSAEEEARELRKRTLRKTKLRWRGDGECDDELGPTRLASLATTRSCRRAGSRFRERRRAGGRRSVFEAEVVDGVENAPLADEGERIIHERPATRTKMFPTKKSREKNVRAVAGGHVAS